MGNYKENTVVVVRQRDELEAPDNDMNEKTDNDKRKLPDDSNITRARLARGKLVESVSEPIFAANMIHGPQGGNLQVIEIVVECVDVVMETERGTDI